MLPPRAAKQRGQVPGIAKCHVKRTGYTVDPDGRNSRRDRVRAVIARPVGRGFLIAGERATRHPSAVLYSRMLPNGPAARRRLPRLGCHHIKKPGTFRPELSSSVPNQSVAKPVEAIDKFGRDELCGLLRVQRRISNGDTTDGAGQWHAHAVVPILGIAKFGL